MNDKQSKKVGFYGGSFDPLHFGHLNLVIELMEKHHLQEVWFCPAWVNPLRQDEPPTEAAHRLKMVQLAIEGIPAFHLVDIECKREKPSYTVETLKELIVKHPDVQLYLLLGDDTALKLLNWHKPEEIVSLVPLLIGSRECETFPLEKFQEHPRIHATMAKGLTQTRILEISSTEIRRRLHQGLFCGHLVPAKVMDYIYAHRLYFRD